MDETNVPTQRAQARQDARIPQADVDEGRPSGDPGPSGEGSSAPFRVTDRSKRPGIGPVRSRETFGDLRRNGARGRHGPLAVSFVAHPEWDRAQVAYAVNRKVGIAVQRNRLRRRLRAIVSAQAGQLPVGAYLVRGGDGAPALEFNELKVAMSRALEKATNRAPQRAGR